MSVGSTAENTNIQKMLLCNEKLPALNTVFEEYRPVLYAIALRMLGYGEDAKDAVQETYIKANTHIHKLKDTSATGAWLMAIIRNYCLMELRYRKRVRKIYLDSIQEYAIAEACQYAEQSPYEIRDALSNLSEPLQLAAMLRYYGRNNSYEEIAAILSIPVGTVRSRLADARMKLADTLKKELPFAKTSKAREMESFYTDHFDHIHNNAVIRESFFRHMEKNLLISLTSGKTARGVGFIEKEIEFNLKYGVCTKLSEVSSSGNISVLEIDIVNPKDNAALCPMAATFIMLHPRSKTEKLLLHNSERAFIAYD